jgi:hypothetical protein
MKAKQTDKKLLLKKATVVQLDKVKMNAVHGGEVPPVTDDTCRRRGIVYD